MSKIQTLWGKGVAATLVSNWKREYIVRGKHSMPRVEVTMGSQNPECQSPRSRPQELHATVQRDQYVFS